MLIAEIDDGCMIFIKLIAEILGDDCLQSYVCTLCLFESLFHYVSPILDGSQTDADLNIAGEEVPSRLFVLLHILNLK